VSITNFLLAVILFILVKQFYPSAIDTLGPVVLGAAVIYGCYWSVAKLPGKWKQRNATKRQEEEDEKAFWEHQGRHKAIRSKYDPKHEWNEVTSVPSEYLREVQQLNLEYREMLQRRNGWTAADFQ
jgi:predicted DNA repair protein MutK